MIYFDTDKEAYQQKETIEKWGKTYLTECSDSEYQELQKGKLMWQGDKIIENPNYDSEQAAKAKEIKTKEINQKISELETMSSYDILFNNQENIKVYQDVIKGLEETRANL